MLTRTVMAVLASSLMALGLHVPAGAESQPATRAEVPAQMQSDEPAGEQRAARGKVTLTASAPEVEEGAVVGLTVRLAKPKRAKRIHLQRWDIPPYYGNASWEQVSSVKARKVRRFDVVATELNQARYRVVVTNKAGKPSKSKPVAVTVWRWIAIHDIDRYYKSSGVAIDSAQANINGFPYRGWGPYTSSNAGAWESRFTPGRHCRSFRAVVGMSDASEDGSSGQVAVTADDAPVYQSPTLTPGMAVHVQVPLGLPYRLSLQAQDTSPDGTQGWPWMGDPALLCTGVE